MSQLRSFIEFVLRCSLIVLQISSTLAGDTGRIVGGVPTTITSAPYLVQLRSNDFIFCSGTLVTKYFVISAAHCFGNTPENFQVVGGATKSYKDPGSARSNVRAYIIPKVFNNVTYHMDIAVIKLIKPLVGKNIAPIPMNCDSWRDGDEVQLFGWGKRQEDDKALPMQLHTAKVRTIQQGWCKWLYFRRRNITDLMFCAADKGKDSCHGDSGGPAIVNKQFCGVVSWGIGCAKTHSPGVYTNLRMLTTFIKRAMKRLGDA